MELVIAGSTHFPRRQTTLSKMTKASPANLPHINYSVKRIEAVTSSYPGMWISIKHRFGPRFSEWAMSWHMFGAALVFMYVGDLFSREAYTMFIQLFRDEMYVGWALLLCSIARLLGLIINGTRPKVTPAIRQWSAAGGFLIWLGISYCFWSSGVLGLWLSTYPIFAIVELFNFYRAAHDHGEIYGRRDK